MSNFFQKPAFGQPGGMIRGFRDGTGIHTSTFDNNLGNHLTDPRLGRRGHDFSLETRLRLDGFNQVGGLEQRVTFLDTLNNSPLKLGS